MSQNGIFRDISTATTLIHMYSKSGNLERETEAFESLKSYGLRPNKNIYTSMITGYRLLLQLEKDGIEIGETPPFELQVSLCYMYSTAWNEKKTLRALGVLEDATRMFKHANLLKPEFNVVSQHSHIRV
ncbi:hypothetical protein Bca4012_055833 [Brassica carinata]